MDLLSKIGQKTTKSQKRPSPFSDDQKKEKIFLPPLAGQASWQQGKSNEPLFASQLTVQVNYTSASSCPAATTTTTTTTAKSPFNNFQAG